MQDLTDQVAVVTGAGSGIGRAIVAELAGAGARVGLVGRDRDALGASAEEAGGRTLLFQCDLEKDLDIAQLAERVRREAGGVDILVHSAAAYFQEPLATAPVEHFDAQYRVNLRAPFLLTQALLPLVVRRRGQVVFINSSTGVRARAGVTQYAAVKHGLKGLADALREEVNGAGVRVISVYPGQTATPMQQKRYAIEGKAYDGTKLIQPRDVAEAVAGALRMGRTGEVTDLFVRPAGR
jgi:NAD(P)-dependent dehydrogenase (short-subunit alcohol dehydrogenase family)